MCLFFFKFTDSENVLNGNAMTASSRLSALNLVAELLRKVNVSTPKTPAFCQIRAI